MKKIGLIAGSDELPLIFAKEAIRDGKAVVAVAIEGYTSPEIEKITKTYWIKAPELGKLIEIFKAEKIHHAVMEGKIPQSIIFSQLDFDEKTIAILKKVKNKQTQSLLKGVADELEKEGINLMDARRCLNSVLAVKGTLTRREPGKNEWMDIKFGKNVLKVIGSLDVGQSVVVKNQAILAIEAIEGTDSAIRRGAILGRGEAVVVKMAKPEQDMRFDLPVIGEKTIETMSEYGAVVLAIEAGKTVVLSKQKVIEEADKLNISIAAI
jgi:DUF1009 family protein